jgi:alpha-L-rhamnosidase
MLMLAALLCLPLVLFHPSLARAATGDWSIQNGAMSAQGGGAGLLGFGYNWTDYTVTFSTEITANQAGWVVRGQSANNNYLLILDADNDTAGPTNALQQVVSNGNGNYVHLASVSLSGDLAPNTWHTLKTVVQGTTVTTFLDGSQIASFNSASFSAGTSNYATGTVGFREYSGESAQFKNLQVTDPGGATLYQNAFAQTTDLNDFYVPGSSAVPHPWPSNPNWWQQYVEAPTSRDVHPAAVVSTAGNVSNAAALTQPGSGQTTTLNWTGSGTAPTLVLDYGKEVGGLPQFVVSSVSGSPTLRAGYSESLQYLSATGDGGTPWGEGDSHRYDDYTVTQAGTLVNRFIQGGERYQELTLTSAGSVTLSSVEIYYEPFQGTLGTFQGYFVTDNPLLNRIWYDGAYTLNQVQMQPDTPSGAWSIQNGSLSVQGGDAALLATGSNWTDYTMTFTTEIITNQSGWVVRGQAPDNNYLLILNADNDTTGTPNALQQLVEHAGTYSSIATVALPFDLKPNTWHAVQTVVRGTVVTTSVDGQQIASFDSSKFASGVPSFASGTVGFREDGSESANFQSLQVVDTNNVTLYQNALTQTSALNDFHVPGNALPLILDGAKRDRAVWEGDLNVSGPTLYYSSDATAYIKDSLQLLGSYQLQSGFVEGDLAPDSPLNTQGPLPGTTASYSASYSMYWVMNMADYYLYTGDSSFVSQEWSAIANELAWNAQQVNSQGLFTTDSSDGDTWHYYDGALTGVVAEFNMLYYRTLTAGVLLANAAGHSDLASTYQTRANALKSAINQYLFNSSTGAYNISTTQTGAVPQDANAFAVLYGVAPASQVSGILSTMSSTLKTTYGELDVSQPASNGGYTQLISPFVSSYDLWARFQSGDTTDAMNLLTSEWGHMATADPASTAWEQMATNGTPGSGGVSDEHGWSTGSTSALSQYVLGVSPVQPGYQSWQIKPQPGSQPWAEGQVPTPHGAIVVQWGQDTTNQQFDLQAQVPASTNGTLAIPISSQQATVQVNGQVVWSNGSFQAAPGITSGQSDGQYVYLTAAGGTTYLVISH